MENLEFLLLQFLVPDNSARNAAEEQIRRFAKDPQLIPALLHHLRTAQSENVRQLAAVLMRKKITGHWMKLTPQVRDSVKSTLLESITQEQSSPVRRASANVASVVAKHTVPNGQWPELLPFLFQCSQSPQEDHREVSLILFSSLTETIGTTLRPHFGTLKSIFLNGLNDPHSNRVRVAALRAVEALVGYVEEGDEVVLFRELIDPILNVARMCLANGEEEVATLAFEIFDDLVESPAPILGSSVIVIVMFALEVCGNTQLEFQTRDSAMQLIIGITKFKPKTVVKHKLIEAILSVTFRILAEQGEETTEEDTADRAAAEVLDTMALSLPKKHVFPSVLSFSVSNCHNADWHIRQAAMMALAVISEGCFEAMKERLPQVLPLVLEALKDPHQAVRGAASFTLGQYAEHLQPEICEHYATILPAIFSVLGDSSPEVQEKAYYALAAFCEHLGQEILPYLGPLMEMLIAGLPSSRKDVQETCMSAIGSAAAAAEAAFVPYAERVLELMKMYMTATKDEELTCRAKATELVGIVGVSIGKALIQPVLPSFIDAALSGFELDYSELREYTHGFFCNVAEILEADLVPYLPRLVPLALASCNLDDGEAIDFSDSDEEEMGNSFGAMSSDDEDSDAKRVRNFSVRTGVLDEKAAATQALGLFALHTKAPFMPYLEDTLKVLVKHSDYFHEDVRLQAIISLQHVLTATQAAFPSSNGVTPEVKHVLDTAMNRFLATMTEDDDKETVAQACSSIVDVIKSVPFSAIEEYIQRLSDATLVLLREGAVCQQTADSDDEGNDEDAEHDDVLMDAVTDILPAMASCMGPSYEVLFRGHYEALMKFAKPSRPNNDRTMAVACLAEVARELGSGIVPYLEAIMSLALEELNSKQGANRRNAAFCVGELCRNGGDHALQYYDRVLLGLSRLFQEGETDSAVRDNAAGAVARMIGAHPHAIPLDQVLPIFVKSLPLKEDFEESCVVYGCVCNLIFSSRPEILRLVPELVPIFAQVVASADITDEVKSGIGRAVTQLLAQFRDQMQPLLVALSDAEKQALSPYVALA